MVKAVYALCPCALLPKDGGYSHPHAPVVLDRTSFFSVVKGVVPLASDAAHRDVFALASAVDQEEPVAITI